MDWAALIVDPNAEYLALVELERYGLKPYLAQAKRLWTAPRSTAPVMRKFPIFPRYLLIGIDDAHHPAVRMARGIIKARPLLADNEGTPWRAPAKVVEAVREAERRGEFDEHAPVRGDKVTMRKGILHGIAAVVGETQSAKALEVLMPLMGGVRAVVAQSAIMRA